MSVKLNIKNLDNHHDDVFKMIVQLDNAIKSSKREEFESIIKFLEHHCFDHFKEEEDIMRQHNFKHLREHQREHDMFVHRIKHIRKLYNENLHTTHVAYGIRHLIDSLILHIQTIDVKMKDIS